MYILKINNQAFISSLTDDVIITSNPDKAVVFSSIGEAMKHAVIVNERLGRSLAQCIRL